MKYPGNPQPGDLIEVFRPGYQHWALYLGDGYVVNVAPLGKLCFQQFLGAFLFSYYRRNHEPNHKIKQHKYKI